MNTNPDYFRGYLDTDWLFQPMIWQRWISYLTKLSLRFVFVLWEVRWSRSLILVSQECKHNQASWQPRQGHIGGWLPRYGFSFILKVVENSTCSYRAVCWACMLTYGLIAGTAYLSKTFYVLTLVWRLTVCLWYPGNRTQTVWLQGRCFQLWYRALGASHWQGKNIRN